MYKYILSIFLLLSSFASFAQSNEVQMADGFYKEGKIYVVITILAIVLVGVAIYLFSIERKLKKLEDSIKDKK
jgi:hypothetical protein